MSLEYAYCGNYAVSAVPLRTKFIESKNQVWHVIYILSLNFEKKVLWNKIYIYISLTILLSSAFHVTIKTKAICILSCNVLTKWRRSQYTNWTQTELEFDLNTHRSFCNAKRLQVDNFRAVHALKGRKKEGMDEGVRVGLLKSRQMWQCKRKVGYW